MTANRQATASHMAGQWNERSLVPALALASFISSVGTSALGPFLPVIAADLRVDIGLVGQVPALAAFVAAGLGFVVGPLADRIGHRRCLLLSLVSLTLSAAGIGLAPGYTMLLLAALVGTLGRAAVSPIARAIAGSRFDGDARRRAMSWTTGGVSLALIAGIPLLTSLDAILGWRAAFAGLALVTAGSAVLLGRLLDRDGPPQAVALRPRDLLLDYLPIARHRPTRILLVAQVFGLAGTGTLLTYLGAFLAEWHGLTTQQVGWVYLGLGVGALAGTLGIASRLGARPLRPLLVNARLACAMLGGLALLLPLPPAAVAGLVVLCAVLMAVCNVAVPTLLAGETPGGQATTMALNAAAMGLGNALGAGLGGLLVMAGGYAALGLGTLGWYSASAILIWWSRPGLAPAQRASEQPAVG